LRVRSSRRPSLEFIASQVEVGGAPRALALDWLIGGSTGKLGIVSSTSTAENRPHGGDGVTRNAFAGATDPFNRRDATR
jgi:hypothetical protein